MQDVQPITRILKRLMDSLFKNTIPSSIPRAESVRSAKVEPLSDILLLTITIKRGPSGDFSVRDATQDSLGLWIRGEILDEHIDTLEKRVNEFVRFLEEK